MQVKTIELKGIGKKYAFVDKSDSSLKDFWALRDISLDAYNGQIVGIIGRNGAGKTTLLKIIAGILSASKGKVLTNGRVVGLFNLGIGFQDELTGRENIFLNGAIIGATKKELNSKLDSIIEFSELGNFIDMPLGAYSQGMRLRLGFSIIANLDFDILLIDEALAVGDSLFQSKCYERLMGFKRSGKTLIITTQDIGLIERLCDEAMLLDHGQLVFYGNTVAAINSYYALLNTEKFFVGPQDKEIRLVKNTKKWAEDTPEWGKKIGTKEVTIDSVSFLNRFGIKTNKIMTRWPLKIKVHFTVKNNIKNPHFGIAIFREDGVYCYGPNTEFDGYDIPELKTGKGFFILEYKNLFLAPGEYRVSIAIWDKNETLAYDYHNGYYRLTVRGYKNIKNELLNMPHAIKASNNLGIKNATLITNQPFGVEINNKLEIYREDGVLCQSIILNRRGKGFLYFPKMPLLPGRYFIRNGSGDNFLNFIFDRHDHGTVYLEHKWRWKTP